MLSVILRLVYFIAGLWLVRQLITWIAGQARKQGGAANRNSSASPPSHMVKDPVCGMYMDARLAVPLEIREGKFYFCSEECRDRFVSPPS